MYPPNGGSEKVGEAALGVIILWFCWLVILLLQINSYCINRFAFNCGSTDSLQCKEDLLEIIAVIFL